MAIDAKSRLNEWAFCVAQSKTSSFAGCNAGATVVHNQLIGGYLLVIESATSREVDESRLRRNSLTLSHIVASTLACIAPAMSFFFGFAVIVQGAGVAAPLTILTAMVAILFLTNTIAQFCRFTPSTGSFVTFTGKAFGPSAGAATLSWPRKFPIVSPAAVMALDSRKPLREIVIYFPVPFELECHRLKRRV